MWDRLTNGLISITYGSSDGIAEPFDANRFTVLMDEIESEAEAERRAEGVMEVDYTFPGDAGTFVNPLDLTGIWN